MLPNFLGIGAQRCATTWLFECLREHPEVFIPEIKEVNYFSDINSQNYEKGLEWYEDYFTSVDDEEAIGEITPEYLIDPKAPERIMRDLGGVKLIVILRDPAERAFSSYKKGIREGHWDVSFEEFIEKNMDYCIDRGMYYSQLSNYFQFFDRENLLIKIYEDLNLDPQAFIKDVYSYLGVKRDFVPTQLNNKFNIGSSKSSQALNFVIKTRDLFYQIPFLSKTVKALQRNKYINGLYSKFMDLENKKMTDKMENQLKCIFEEDIYKLSNVLDANLEKRWLGNH